LFAEEIGDGRRILVEVYALGPTAVDIVKHALERPQPRQQAKAVVVGELTGARRFDHGVHGRDGGVLFAARKQLLSEDHAGFVDGGSHRELGKLHISQMVFTVRSGILPLEKLCRNCHSEVKPRISSRG
jgi:hypothetical protein